MQFAFPFCPLLHPNNKGYSLQLSFLLVTHGIAHTKTIAQSLRVEGIAVGTKLEGALPILCNVGPRTATFGAKSAAKCANGQMKSKRMTHGGIDLVGKRR